MRSAERRTLDRLGLGAECRMACITRVQGPVVVDPHPVLETAPGPEAARPAAVHVDRALHDAIRHVVIVGAGVAGVTATEELRRALDAAELTLVGAALERLLALSRPGMLLVGDSALGRHKTLCQLDRAGLEFIVPLRADTGFKERYLAELGARALRPLRYLPERERRLPAARRTRYRGALRDWEIEDPDTGATRRFRVAFIHSSEEAQQVAAARERALLKAEEQLGRVTRGLGGRYYKTKTQVQRRVGQIIGANIAGLICVNVGSRTGKPTLSWQRDHAAIAHAAATDGIYALATNKPGRLSATRVLELYKDQEIVERRHRDLKQTLKVRPIFLHNDDRIHALVSIVGLALLIFGLIESQLRRALDGQTLDLLPEGRAAKPTGRNILATFQGLGLTYTTSGPVLDRLTHTQRRILDLLEIQPPWPEQEPEN
jgi:transposase